MKRCPLCNRTYQDNALSFCLTDGSALIKDEPAAPSPPPPTILAPPATDWSSPRAPVMPSPGAWNSGGLSQQPLQSTPAWSGGYQPPVYGPSPEQGLAIASLVCGILSFLCCNILTGIPAIILGIMAINKEKSDPQRYTGKGMAIGGLVLGGVSVLIFFVYILALLAGVIK
jgi:hypothetical protein